MQLKRPGQRSRGSAYKCPQGPGNINWSSPPEHLSFSAPKVVLLLCDFSPIKARASYWDEGNLGLAHKFLMAWYLDYHKFALVSYP